MTHQGEISIAQSITASAAAGKDAQGGTVTSLTEAVMGMTSALTEIAEAINRIAFAIEERPAK